MFWTFLAIILVVLIALPFWREWRRDKVDVLRDNLVQRDTDANGIAINEGFVALSDGITYYRWHGKTSDSVIVLIHGLTTPSWVFSGLVRGLTMMGYQVLCYDLYGRGLSDAPRDRQTPQFFLRQLTDLLDALGLEGQISLMGYSMGGMIATLFAGTYPDRVDRMILLAPGGIDYTPAEPLHTAGLTGLLGDWLWGLWGPRTIRKAAERDAAGPTVVVDINERMTRETGRRGYARSVLSAHRETLLVDLEDVYRDVGRTDIPVLAIWGAEDRVIPQTAIGTLTLWNRGARHHVVKRAGHGLPHTAPNEVIGAITRFLKEVPRRASME